MSPSNSKIKYFIRDLEFFPKNDVKNFIYYETRGLIFNTLHHEFQKIMREEFADAIKKFQISLNHTIYKKYN